ncbi:three component ABC system middle component [Flavobacterium sp.]|uniref:three component ABC system middle component n=1 Tax=Flavobacterium sp. TaxID=239 RepID=UPI003750ACFC
MNKNINLFDVLQNSTLGAIAIHSFILGYNNVAKHKANKQSYPKIDYLFFVLPIVYDYKSLKSIKYKLDTSIDENKELTLGLQNKADRMSRQTLDSLNMGFNKLIFKLNKENYTVELTEDCQKEITVLMKFSNDTIKDIQIISKRLGNIFAKRDEKKIQIELNIRF